MQLGAQRLQVKAVLIFLNHSGVWQHFGNEFRGFPNPGQHSHWQVYHQ